MPAYKYKARERNGKIKEGIVKAENPEVASIHVSNSGLILVSLKEEKEKDPSKSGIGIRLKPKDISVFTTQLHTLLVAGLSVVAALKALEKSTSNPILQKVLRQIRESVEGGGNLADSFSQHKKYFDQLYCNMIRAGEASGT